VPRSTAGEASYVLPLRWAEPGPIDELAAYLRLIAPTVGEILVVDGSPEPLFRRHAEELRGVARHLAPHPDLHFRMGKVDGVTTGIRECSCEHVVLADDDVRYDAAALRRTVAMLDEADLVRPQNYFDALPWHARWDTARTLLNRCLGRDYPGTLAVRRSRMLAMGLYDGDVLFENLELIRTVRAHGGSTVAPLDLYVARVPPSAAHFWGQRTRQAYDDFALPVRMALWLAVVPLVALAAFGDRIRLSPQPGVAKIRYGVTALVPLAVLAAERGRRRANGSAVFPASSSLLAPVWILERGICAWLAVLQRLRFGGVRYGDSVIPVAAHSERQLRRLAA
jgi:hypothetical protein